MADADRLSQQDVGSLFSAEGCGGLSSELNRQQKQPPVMIWPAECL
jgi:hypothetical protein